jgi:hypothetical protein
MSKPTVSIVVGGGHSIGVPLAVSAKRSFIVPSATMTIHPVRMNGMLLGIPQTLSYFERMQERITAFVTNNSRIKSKRFLEFMMEKDELVMDVGSVVDGNTAVSEGLIDELGGLSEAITCLYDLAEEWKKEKEIKEAAKRNKAEKAKKSRESKEKKEAKDDTSHNSKPKRGAQGNSKSKNTQKSAEPKKRGRPKKSD